MSKELMLRYIEVTQEYIEELETKEENLTKQIKENQKIASEHIKELGLKCNYYEKLLQEHNISFLKYWFRSDVKWVRH